jgi:hypothetical protein
MNVVVEERQSIFDVAIQHVGTAESAFAIAYENGKSVSDPIYSGDVLSISDNAVNDVPKFMADNMVIPVTKPVERKAIFDITFDLTFDRKTEIRE